MSFCGSCPAYSNISLAQNKITPLPVFTRPSCGSHHTIKNGSIHNRKPKRQCR